MIDFAFENQQRRGRALLAAVAERAVEHVLDRLIAIGERGDDRGVLAAGFGQQMHRRLVREHFGGGRGAAGEDHGVDAVVRRRAAAPTVPPLHGANCSAVFGTPARQKHWHSW